MNEYPPIICPPLITEKVRELSPEILREVRQVKAAAEARKCAEEKKGKRQFDVWFVHESDLGNNIRFSKPMNRAQAVRLARELLGRRGANKIREVLIKGRP